jgi:PilZ domain
LSDASFSSQPPDAGTRFADRRAVPRYPFVAAIEMFEPIARIRIAGRTSEIGLNGCYVDILNPLPEKTVCQIRIERDSETFETWGRVVYIHPGIGMGVAFFETAPEQRATISEWISKLSTLQAT